MDADGEAMQVSLRKRLKIGATKKRFDLRSLPMANTGRLNSGGSQFFPNVANNSNLDKFGSGASKHHHRSRT